MNWNVKKIILLIIIIYSVYQIGLWLGNTHLWDDARNIAQANIAFYASIFMGAFLSFRSEKLRYLLFFFILGVIAFELIFKVQYGDVYMP